MFHLLHFYWRVVHPDVRDHEKSRHSMADWSSQAPSMFVTNIGKVLKDFKHIAEMYMKNNLQRSSLLIFS